MANGFLELLSRFMAARSGQLANYDNARLEGNIARAQALFDPAVRQDPNTLRALGLKGAPLQSGASAIAGGPGAMERYVLNNQAGRYPGMPSDTPAMVETDAGAIRSLRSAQAQEASAQARLLSSLLGQVGGGGRPPRTLLGTKPGSISAGGLNLPLGPEPPSAEIIRDLGVVRRTFPNLGPKIDQLGNAALTDPEIADALNAVQQQRATLGKPAAQAVKGQVSRLDASLAAFQGLNDPIKFPNGQGVSIWDAMGQFRTPGIGQGGILGTAGELLQQAPGASTVAGARLKGWANDQTLPPDERAARQQVVAKIETVNGLVANAVKALGDAGNLAEGEQRVLREAFLPIPGEDPGLSRQKVERAMEIMRAMREGLAGQLTRADVRNFLAQQLGTQFSGDETKRARDSERVTDIDAENGTVVAGGAASTRSTPQPTSAPTGRSSYDANTLQQFKQELFGPR